MKRTILVVDDDEVLGQVLSRVLERLNYRVCRASSAHQALRLLRENLPQLALLDLCLPDTDGVELSRQLRAIHPDLVVLLMTAYPIQLQQSCAVSDEFSQILTKPLDLAELREALAASEALCAVHELSRTRAQPVPAR